jgi:long-chain fatty acid transport protein
MKKRIVRGLAPLLALSALAPLAHATNGMLLEGYGPIATGMGGAASAYDNGVAAATNNPATLGLAAPGARLDLALGLLGPRVTSSVPGMYADSSGKAYVMPAGGFARGDGTLTWGVAVFAQGGMGTEYSATSFLAMGSGEPVRSELGVGRLLVPVAWKVSPDLIVGGSVDFVWSSLDLRMAASGAQLGAMTTAADGNLGAALPGLAMAPWARIDFSDSSRYSGAAKAHGAAAKLGVTWDAAPGMRVGASYHTRTHLGNMTTSSSGASMSAPGFADAGSITVLGFQMPSEAALGVAWQANADLLVAADLKRIGWSSTMDAFRMRYDSAQLGGSVSFELPQHWRDQTVLAIGATQRLSPQWVARAGINVADNPVPSDYVNPLFPAIVQNHLTVGGGWLPTQADAVNVSFTYAPEVSVTNASGVTVSHHQLNLQAMYSRQF